MALDTGTRLGTYEITGFLGAGGMGEIWRARDTKLGREVAGKNRDIWIWDTKLRSLTRLTDGPTEDMLPLWSPDGKKLVMNEEFRDLSILDVSGHSGSPMSPASARKCP